MPNYNPTTHTVVNQVTMDRIMVANNMTPRQIVLKSGHSAKTISRMRKGKPVLIQAVKDVAEVLHASTVVLIDLNGVQPIEFSIETAVHMCAPPSTRRDVLKKLLTLLHVPHNATCRVIPMGKLERSPDGNRLVPDFQLISEDVCESVSGEIAELLAALGMKVEYEGQKEHTR